MVLDDEDAEKIRHAALLEPLHRLDHHVVPFAPHEPAGDERDLSVASHAPRLPDGLDAGS
jgi:hypothetical protein